MPHPNVRRATKTDGEKLGDLWEALLGEQSEMEDRLTVSEDARERWENDVPVWLSDETRRIYVAEEDGEIVGFATAHRTAPPPIYESEGEVYLDEIYVRPERRNEGFGAQLVEAVTTWADQVQAERVRFSVLAKNGDARAFWEEHEAAPFTITYTIERTARKSDEKDEGIKKIGF
jgi:GNAT superfamily N-acetyltransferase